MKVVESVNFAYDGKTDRIHLYACFKESATVTRVEPNRYNASKKVLASATIGMDDNSLPAKWD